MVVERNQFLSGRTKSMLPWKLVSKIRVLRIEEYTNTIDPEIKLSIKEIPESDLSQDEAEEGVPSAESSSIATSPANLVDKTDRAASATTEKYEWYQNAQEVIISFYFKKVKQDQCRVDIGPSSVKFTLV